MNVPKVGQLLVRLAPVVLAAALFALSPSASARSGLSDADARNQMIQESIRGYRGNCPCPYNLASNGSRCGKRSAYARGGGAQPLCYPEDITDRALSDWQKRTGN